MPIYNAPASSDENGGSSITAGADRLQYYHRLRTGHAAVNVDGSEVAKIAYGEIFSTIDRRRQRRPGS